MIGNRPENAHSCYAVKGERFAKTREEALSFKKPFENVSLRFDALIACGFLLQLTLWLIQMVEFFCSKQEEEYDIENALIMAEEKETKSSFEKNLYTIRCLVLTATLIFVYFLFSWRGGHAGSVCSGEYLSDSSMTNVKIDLHYELSKGLFLKMIMVYYAILAFAVACYLVMSFFALEDIKDEELEEEQYQRFKEWQAKKVKSPIQQAEEYYA